MAGRTDLLQSFYASCLCLGRGVMGLEDCESLSPYMIKSRVLAEEHLPRRFLPIQNPVRSHTLKNVFWPPDPKNPADGLTILKCDLVPLRALLNEEACVPGALRPLRGVTTCARSPGSLIKKNRLFFLIGPRPNL